jgi:hypothetical protein
MSTPLPRSIAAGALALLACDPELPLPHAGAGAGGSAGGLAVSSEPPAPLDAAPRVLRLHLDGAGPLDPAAVALVRGAVGPVQLHEIAVQHVSAALSARLVPALVFPEGAAVVVAPTVALDPGEHYTLAVGPLLQTVAVDVAPADPLPLLRRLWPPAGASGPAAGAVWCGDAPLPRFDAAVTLAPAGPAGWVRRGALPAGAGARCLRFEAEATGAAGAWVPPPLVASSADPSIAVRLSPEPLRAGTAGAAPSALGCGGDEIAFGPGCVQVEDDRVLGRSPGWPSLWVVAGAGVDSVLTTGPGDPFVISGLPPATDATLDVGAIDARGTVFRMLVTAVTSAPMPHVVLNEVLANPLGPEPAQEWVEIVNDGHAPVDLGGYVLVDGGGETALPPAVLGPGAFALLVNDAFDPQATADPCPAPGTRLLRVPHLGKNGLSNAGEPLGLRDPDGVVVSRLPSTPKPKPGRSLARLTPAAPDGLAASFALAAPSPGRANAW